MRKLITVYVYGLAAIALLQLLGLASGIRITALVHVAIAFIVAFMVIHGYRIGNYPRLKIGSFYYGYVSVGTIVLAALSGSVFFYLFSAIAVLGCYTLGFSSKAKSLISENGDVESNSFVKSEYESSEDYIDYKGHAIRKSPNYLWVGKLRFSDVKKAEAYIQNNLVEQEITGDNG
jgi:hypothetical protein